MPFPTATPVSHLDPLQAGKFPASRARRLSTASVTSLKGLDRKSRTSQDSQPNQAPSPRIIPLRQPLVMRSQSYAPSTVYSAQQALAAPASIAPHKKRKNLNLGSKIDAWWSAVTKSFTSPTEESKAGSTGKTAASRVARPAQPRAASDTLATNVEAAEPVGRISAQMPRDRQTLAPPLQAVRQVSSTSDLKSEVKASVSQPPSGALAPAARTARQQSDSLAVGYQPHSRVNSAGSEGDGSSASGSATRSEFRRRNPQLSLRLDPRFQQATALKLGEKRSNESSEKSSSASGGIATHSPAFFKEPRPPPRAYTAQHHEQTPSLTPGQSPIWDRTPGLVPVSQANAMKITRSPSKQTLPPIIQEASTRNPQRSPQQTLAPTFSMSHIRDHIKHRLTGAKSSCDKELRKVIVGITTYVERDLDNEKAFDIRAESRQEVVDASSGDIAQQHEASTVTGEDTGNEAEDELDHPKLVNIDRPALPRHDTSSSGSHPPSSHPSRVGSPSSHPVSQSRRVTNPPTRGRSSGHSSPRRFSLQAKRGSPGMVRPADLAARLEQSLDLGGDGGTSVSQNSSRSTSRSRSPMPGPGCGLAPQRNSSAEWYNRHNPYSAAEEDKRHFLHSLQAIVAIAQEIVDTSVKDLTDDPSTCAQLIKRVQKIGKKWDDNPHWPLRGWYVQLLLAVAGLSRVSEFWAEERGFWNFGTNEQDEHDTDPILFVAKAPAMEEEPSQTGSARSRAVSGSSAPSARFGASEESQVSSLGIDLGIHRVDEEAGDTSLKVSGPPAADDSGTTRAEEAEVLREAVEEVRNATILMELALDGESFQYISPVWEDVVGYAPFPSDTSDVTDYSDRQSLAC